MNTFKSINRSNNGFNFDRWAFATSQVLAAFGFFRNTLTAFARHKLVGISTSKLRPPNRWSQAFALMGMIRNRKNAPPNILLNRIAVPGLLNRVIPAAVLRRQTLSSAG